MSELYPVVQSFIKKQGVLYPTTHTFVKKTVEVPVDTDFSITVDSGEDSSFILPTSGRLNNTNNSYNWIVDWGDGTVTEHSGMGTTTSGITHSYPSANTLYTIKIKPIDINELGWLRALGFSFASSGSNEASNKSKVRIIDGQLTEQMIRVNMNNTHVCYYMFYNCSNLTMGNTFQLPQDIASVGGSFCRYMFRECLKFNNE